MQKKITMSPKNHGNIVSHNEIYMVKLLTSLSEYDRSQNMITIHLIIWTAPIPI